MEKVLFKYYLKYLKENNKKKWDRLWKIPNKLKVCYIVIIVFSVIPFFQTLTKTLDDLTSWMFVLIAWLACGVCFYWSELYIIDIADDSFQDYVSYCKKLKEWLLMQNIDSSDMIKSIINRINDEINQQKSKKEKVSERITGIIKAFIIPMVLVVIGEYGKSEGDFILAVSRILTIFIVFVLIFIVAFLVANTINLYKITYIAKLQMFISDLQGVLDLEMFTNNDGQVECCKEPIALKKAINTEEMKVKRKFLINKYLKKAMDYFVEIVLFLIVSIITVIFIASPWWLECDSLSSGVSNILDTLKTEGYKTTYIETMGAILGTFLAISAALWTQRRENKRQEQNIIKEAAVIVYYDFKFVFEDLFKFEKAYACIKPGIENEYDDLEYFLKYKSTIKIYIDSNWIANVAKLCNVLSAEEIKQIYKIYGDLETVKEVFDRGDEDIDSSTARKIYNLIQCDLCTLTLAPSIKVSHNIVNEKLMKRLETMALGE